MDLIHIRGIDNVKVRQNECVLTIGNFDGFHRGHQALISTLQKEGRQRNLPVTVMIFEPQPQEYFAGINAPTIPTRLSSLRDKVKYLTAAGVDTIICVIFNQSFAAISAYQFITELLVKKLRVRLICVGDDFHFGAGRYGNFSYLVDVSHRYGFETKKILTYADNGQRISSTAIRKTLEQNQLEKAAILMGHPYMISGRVVHGDALGRTIGFPTANLALKGLRYPINGVYAVEVYGVIDTPLLGVANIGSRPTVNGGLEQRLEVHLLNLKKKNLYGCYIEVVIRAKVRNEHQFHSLEDLRKQIKNDVINIQKYFRLAQ